MANILVVDDKYYVRIKMRTILEKAGHRIIDAENGNEAISKYKSEKPDIVLCDIIMPELDGISALKAIIEHDKDARVVMVTSLSEQTIVMEAIALGAKEVINKPFEEDKVLEIVNKYKK